MLALTYFVHMHACVCVCVCVHIGHDFDKCLTEDCLHNVKYTYSIKLFTVKNEHLCNRQEE